MDTPTSISAAILIATDNVTDAALVKSLLHPEFDHVFISTDSDKAAEDFVRHQPDVLVLAFNTLEKSEHYYLELYRLCEEVHQYPHRTIILCSLGEIERAYELCNVHFDDYLLFWPMVHDTLRLRMLVHHALCELAAIKADGPSAAEFAAQAHRMVELEKILDQQVDQGGQHLEVASRAMEQAEQKIGTSLDGFFQRFISGGVPDSDGTRSADGLEKEISRFKREEVQQHFSAVAESTQPMKQWAQKFRQKCEPLLKSVRAMNAMAGRIQPAVLVVDDNEPQRKILGKLLKAENYHPIFAGDGLEALKVLRAMQPDLILMDIMMPNMNGLDTVRRLKAAPRFAKTPVIMITGKSGEDVVADCVKAGAVDFVAKPFDHAILLAKIANALNATIQPEQICSTPLCVATHRELQA